jgi:CrcB protein
VRYLLIVLGGGAGSLLRFLAGTAIMTRFGRSFPLGTLAINVTGSFRIGLLMRLFTERFQPHTNLRLLLVVGFLGGYTTFSRDLRGSSRRRLLDGPGEYRRYLAVWLGALVARR